MRRASRLYCSPGTGLHIGHGSSSQWQLTQESKIFRLFECSPYAVRLPSRGTAMLAPVTDTPICFKARVTRARLHDLHHDMHAFAPPSITYLSFVTRLCSLISLATCPEPTRAGAQRCRAFTCCYQRYSWNCSTCAA